MKIDLLVSKNTYDTTLFFAKSLQMALQRQKVILRTFWIDEGYFFHAFYEILNDPPDLTLSFSDIRLENTPLADLWQIPHFSFLIDPAIYFLHHLKSPFSLVSCVDEEDVSFIKTFGFEKALFLPHGADPKELTSPETERPFEAVFFGSCIDYEEVKKNWERKFSKKTQKLLLDAATLVLSSAHFSTLKSLLELGVEEENLSLFHYEVDQYVRGKDRVDLLKDKKVTIWGHGPWKKYCPKAKVHPACSFDQSIDIMKRSKIVFNSSPRFKFGSHERLFYAPLCGAAVVTGESPYIKKAFSKEEIFTYLYGSHELSDSFSQWKEIAEKAQRRVLKDHTWDERAKTLLNFLRSHGCATN